MIDIRRISIPSEVCIVAGKGERPTEQDVYFLSKMSNIKESFEV